MSLSSNLFLLFGEIDVVENLLGLRRECCDLSKLDKLIFLVLTFVVRAGLGFKNYVGVGVMTSWVL